MLLSRSTTCGPISRRSSSGTTSGSIIAGRMRSHDGAPPRAAPRRERRGPRRRRELRRIRAARPRRSTPATRAAGAHRTDTGRWSRRWHRHRRRSLDRRDVVRLHGARGNAGHVEPREERPALRARGAPAAPGRLLHRGRRRPSGRHRRRDGRRARHARVPPVRAAQWPGAARRHHDRLLLRRERGAARLL